MKKAKKIINLRQSISLDGAKWSLTGSKEPTPIYTNKKLANKMRTRKIKLYGKDETKPCHWCGTPLKLNDATLDHLIDKADGGTNSQKNLAISCHGCNNKRGNLNEQARRGNLTREAAQRIFNKYMERKRKLISKIVEIEQLVSTEELRVLRKEVVKTIIQKFNITDRITLRKAVIEICKQHEIPKRRTNQMTANECHKIIHDLTNKKDMI